jgi:hypothetical protein
MGFPPSYTVQKREQGNKKEQVKKHIKTWKKNMKKRGFRKKSSGKAFRLGNNIIEGEASC